MELNQYLEMFIEESKEHLQSCSEHLLELEKNPEDLAIVSEIFRSAHTLKGMSATMGYEDLADLTHKMENVLDAIRNEKIKVNADILDVVFESVDHLEAMVYDIAEGGDGKRDVQSTVEMLKSIEAGDANFKQAQSAVVEQVATTSVTTTDSGLTATKLTYDSFEATVLSQSQEQEFNVYEVSVVLREDCLLKAARVFMVFEILEKNGDIIKSSPTVDQLEEEQFDSEFNIAYITKLEAEDLQKMLLKVSEVEKVTVTPINGSLLNASIEETANQRVIQEVVADVVEVAATATAAVDSSKSATTNKASAPTHTSSKTIRVNIERLDILMNLLKS